jgi:hypothetical protein
MTSGRRKIHVVLTAAVTALAVVLSGCGSSPETPSTSPPVGRPPVKAPAQPPAQPPAEDRNPGLGSHTVSGHTYDRDGQPLANVDVLILFVPRRLGDLYQTRSDSRGRYSYHVPEGVYNVIVSYDDPSDDDPVGIDLVVVENGELSAPITVPPSQVIDFMLP